MNDHGGNFVPYDPLSEVTIAITVICHLQLQDSGGSASGSFEQGSNINDDIRQNATKR